MKKGVLILIIAAIVIAGILFLNKIKFTQKPNQLNQPSLSQIEDLSATALPSQNMQTKNATSSLLLTELPSLGNPSAPVKIYIFSDYQCPYCKKLFNDSEKKIRNEFISKGLVVLYYKDYVFLGEESLFAANAARCANEQGKFWEYHDLLFEKQGAENSGAFNKNNLKIFAQELGLDTKKMNQCIDIVTYENLIIKDLEEGQKLGVRGTPYILINNKGFNGAYPYEQIRQTILKELQP